VGEGQVDVSFCAHGCGDVSSFVIELVAAALAAPDEFGHGLMLQTTSQNTDSGQRKLQFQ